MTRTRVLDPDGALPAAATRLDPVGPTGHGEQLLHVEALVLAPRGADLAADADGAALARAMEDRGGLPRPTWDGALLARQGDRRVVLLAGLAGVPVWARPRWDASDRSVVHLAGHAVVDRSHPRTLVEDGQDVLAAVASALAAHVRAVVAQLDAPLVVLGDGALVTVAVTTAAASGHATVATARTLRQAQALDAAGARVLLDLGDTPATALATLRGAMAGLPDEPGVLLLGRVPPVRGGPDGVAAARWPPLAGMLAPRVDVVGSVDVDSISTGAGATVVLHGVARDAGLAGEVDGWA